MQIYAGILPFISECWVAFICMVSAFRLNICKGASLFSFLILLLQSYLLPFYCCHRQMKNDHAMNKICNEFLLLQAALGIMQMVEDTLIEHAHTKPLLPSQLVRYREVQLPDSKWFSFSAIKCFISNFIVHKL